LENAARWSHSSVSTKLLPNFPPVKLLVCPPLTQSACSKRNSQIQSIDLSRPGGLRLMQAFLVRERDFSWCSSSVFYSLPCVSAFPCRNRRLLVVSKLGALSNAPATLDVPNSAHSQHLIRAANKRHQKAMLPKFDLYALLWLCHLCYGCLQAVFNRAVIEKHSAILA
jgi:hypothetical protein